MTEIEGWQTLDDKGVKMPWYTRPCLEWLDKLDLKGKVIFEYGCGASSVWFNYRGANVVGVDRSCEWTFLDTQLVTTDKQKYLTFIDMIGQVLCGYDPPFLSGDFINADIVVIDGDFRDECIQYALNRTKKGGYIIIDNWKQATADLPEWPITEKLIEGMDITIYKEPTHQDWKTLVIHV